jgi:hypothetical protein
MSAPFNDWALTLPIEKWLPTLQGCRILLRVGVRGMRTFLGLLVALICAGCVTTEPVSFRPAAGQQAIVRDGAPALVSQRKNSIVIARPASRQLQIGGRPVFVLGIYNRTKGPLEFRVANVHVAQVVNGETTPIKVITYEELVQEEHTRQVFAAIATGVAAGANAYSASRVGYYNANSTVYTPGGTYNVHTTGYSPTANTIAQANASAQNAEMISATIERGQANLVSLERAVIKDDTLMPGEWYGGQLHLAPLVQGDSHQKNYTITVRVCPDIHELTVAQGQPPSS